MNRRSGGGRVKDSMPADTIPGLLKHLLAKQFKSCGECVEAAHSLLGIYTFTLSWQTRRPLALLKMSLSLQEEWLPVLGEEMPGFWSENSPSPNLDDEMIIRSAQVQQLPNQAWAWVPDREDDRALVEYLRLEGWG